MKLKTGKKSKIMGNITNYTNITKFCEEYFNKYKLMLSADIEIFYSPLPIHIDNHIYIGFCFYNKKTTEATPETYIPIDGIYRLMNNEN